jgi:UDP-glucose 4-epimerase
MANVLIVGANGFVGSHLVDGLARLGHTVTAFDRFSTPPTFEATGVRILPGEFLNRSDVDAAVAGQELVFHFLSTTSPATAERDPTLDVRTNVVSTVDLLQACVKAGTRHVYFASSGGAIYGPQGRDSYVESDRTEPVSPYAIGKLSIENYLRYFHLVHGLSSTSFRISNPYGTRQRLNKLQGLIPIALRQVIAGKPIEIFGDGSMVRDYLYVEDLVKMICAFVEAEPAHAVYNLGSGRGYSVSEVVEVIGRATGISTGVVRRDVPRTFVDRVVLDTERFTSEFGAVDLTSLEDGVLRTFRAMSAESNG